MRGRSGKRRGKGLGEKNRMVSGLQPAKKEKGAEDRPAENG